MQFFAGSYSRPMTRPLYFNKSQSSASENLTEQCGNRINMPPRTAASQKHVEKLMAFFNCPDFRLLIKGILM